MLATRSVMKSRWEVNFAATAGQYSGGDGEGVPSPETDAPAGASGLEGEVGGGGVGGDGGGGDGCCGGGDGASASKSGASGGSGASTLSPSGPLPPSPPVPVLPVPSVVQLPDTMLLGSAASASLSATSHRSSVARSDVRYRG